MENSWTPNHHHLVQDGENIDRRFKLETCSFAKSLLLEESFKQLWEMCCRDLDGVRVMMMIIVLKKQQNDDDLDESVRR